MIKGINKRVFVVNCKSDVFEQAFFIVNPNSEVNNIDISAEAERIVTESTSLFEDIRSKKKKKHKSINGFFG